MKSLNIVFKNDLAELQRVYEGVDSFLETEQIPEETVFTVHLSLEEMISNIIKYGFDDAASHDISLQISAQGKKLKIVIEDDGIEFNPVSVPEKDTQIPLHEKKIGGLGIHLVKNMVQDISYSRKNGKNHLELTIK